MDTKSPTDLVKTLRDTADSGDADAGISALILEAATLITEQAATIAKAQDKARIEAASLPPSNDADRYLPDDPPRPFKVGDRVRIARCV